jgi:uncharacterized repeat protein (TIGR03803 family)
MSRNILCGHRGSSRHFAARLFPPAIEALEDRRLLSATLTTLAAFNFTNGAEPHGLIADSAGNLYGTTRAGGANTAGTVFEVPKGGGSVVTLATFDGTNGAEPYSNVIIDSAGNLYGTTVGGANTEGTVFEVPQGSGRINVLASFSGPDGSQPFSNLITDAGGNLYGTTEFGGASDHGTVFEVPQGGGGINVLASFSGPDGSRPTGGLVADSAGNLYGTTQFGGANATSGTIGDGTVFEVPQGGGTITTLASFNGTNGTQPLAGLIADSAGNLYGTTTIGGADGDGTVFEVAAGSGGITTLATFNTTNGSQPDSVLIADSAGNLYGTTSGGGANNDGTVFEVPQGGGTVTTLATFNNTNGRHPHAGLIADSAGNLYGTTIGGGPNSFGTVFELSPGFIGTGGGGGGGGSTGTSPLSPTVAKSSLPPSVIAGGTAHGVAVVDLTNTGSTAESGKVTVDIYASNDGVIDDSSVLIGSISRKLNVKDGKTAKVTVPIKSLPASLDGNYSLLAKVIDSAGDAATSTTGPQLTAAAPFIAFSDTLISTNLGPSDVSGQKTHSFVKLKITNNGNIVSAGESSIAILASPDTSAADGTLIRSMTKAVKLKPGASRVVKVPLLSLPAVADGNYFLVAQVTDPNADVTTAASTGTYQLAAPFVSLVPSAASVAVARNGTATVKFTVTNNGNIAPIGASTVTVNTSADGTVANSQPVFTQQKNLRLHPNKSQKLQLKLSALEVTTLQANAAAFLVVTDPLGGSQSILLSSF